MALKLKDSKRIGSKRFKMHVAYSTHFESSFPCPMAIAHLKLNIAMLQFQIS